MPTLLVDCHQHNAITNTHKEDAPMNTFNKVQVIQNQADNEVIIVTCNGGVACIREVEPVDDNDHRISTTEMFKRRLTDISPEDITEECDIWSNLGEGEMQYEDSDNKPYNSLSLLISAIEWLGVDADNCLLVEDALFPDIHFLPITVQDDTPYNELPLYKDMFGRNFELGFDLSQFPALVDKSYANDICPTFYFCVDGEYFTLIVEHEDASHREYSEEKRYTIIRSYNDDIEESPNIIMYPESPLYVTENSEDIVHYLTAAFSDS
jgi:hypothetical protein